MTSSNWGIFCVTNTLCGEFTGYRWIPLTRTVMRSFDAFFYLRLNYAWVNNREAGDLRRHRIHYVVTFNILQISSAILMVEFDKRKLIRNH